MVDPEPLQPPSPPLRVHHFFLAMTCMAMVASWRVGLNSRLEEVPARLRASNNSPADILRISFSQTMYYGGMLTVVIASVAWKLRHRTTAWQPGQWLAALGAADFLHEVALTLPRFVSWFGSPEDGPQFTLPVRREFAYYLACAVVIAFVAARRTDYGWVWRAALGVLAIQLLEYSLSNGALIAAGIFRWDQPTRDAVFEYSITLANYVRMAALCAIAFAAAVNLVRGPRNSWMHWTGVVLWLAFQWSFEIARYLAALDLF